MRKITQKLTEFCVVFDDRIADPKFLTYKCERSFVLDPREGKSLLKSRLEACLAYVSVFSACAAIAMAFGISLKTTIFLPRVTAV